jgi:hypothetical protein
VPPWRSRGLDWEAENAEPVPVNNQSSPGGRGEERTPGREPARQVALLSQPRSSSESGRPGETPLEFGSRSTPNLQRYIGPPSQASLSIADASDRPAAIEQAISENERPHRWAVVETPACSSDADLSFHDDPFVADRCLRVGASLHDGGFSLAHEVRLEVGSRHRD